MKTNCCLCKIEIEKTNNNIKYCNNCKKVAKSIDDHKYYIKNMEKIKLNSRNYRLNHLEEIKKSQKTYRKNNFVPKIKTVEKENLRREKIGKTLSEKYYTGEITPSFGMLDKKHSEDTKIKMRKKALGRKMSECSKLKISKFQLGKVINEKTLLKMKNYWNSKEGIEIAKNRRAKQIFPKRDTSIEIKIRGFLDTLQIEYFQHKYLNINHAYQCDFFIPSKNLVIECDGDYWHKYPTGRDIDKIRTSELIEKGFKVLRLWEREINEMNIDKFRNIVNN